MTYSEGGRNDEATAIAPATIASVCVSKPKPASKCEASPRNIRPPENTNITIMMSDIRQCVFEKTYLWKSRSCRVDLCNPEKTASMIACKLLAVSSLILMLSLCGTGDAWASAAVEGFKGSGASLWVGIWAASLVSLAVVSLLISMLLEFGVLRKILAAYKGYLDDKAEYKQRLADIQKGGV